MSSENTFVLQQNSVIEVKFIGGKGHYFHLQYVTLPAFGSSFREPKAETDWLLSGHSFDVIQSASGGGPNFVNPPRRDVVASGTTDNPILIRFRTDNPGSSTPCLLDLSVMSASQVRGSSIVTSTGI